VFRDYEVNGESIRLVNHPNRYDGKVPELRSFALEQGANTRELLAEAGYGDGEVSELLKSGVVHAPST
jgi:crotonobetainyl-CoA:carnitine CoA-transferase CaiB-like acyl-CoA transferase